MTDCVHLPQIRRKTTRQNTAQAIDAVSMGQQMASVVDKYTSLISLPLSLVLTALGVLRMLPVLQRLGDAYGF